MCFQAALGLAHESLLKATATSTDVKLPGTLRGCEDCVLAKGIRAPIAKQTSNRSDQKLGRVIAGLSGEKDLPAPRKKRYANIFRTNYSRFMWAYVSREKSDARSALKRFLCYTRSDGDVVHPLVGRRLRTSASVSTTVQEASYQI